MVESAYLTTTTKKVFLLSHVNFFRPCLKKNSDYLQFYLAILFLFYQLCSCSDVEVTHVNRVYNKNV